jgi:hypothetical protein
MSSNDPSMNRDEPGPRTLPASESQSTLQVHSAVRQLREDLSPSDCSLVFACVRAVLFWTSVAVSCVAYIAFHAARLDIGLQAIECVRTGIALALFGAPFWVYVAVRSYMKIVRQMPIRVVLGEEIAVTKGGNTTHYPISLCKWSPSPGFLNPFYWTSSGAPLELVLGEDRFVCGVDATTRRDWMHELQLRGSPRLPGRWRWMAWATAFIGFWGLSGHVAGVLLEEWLRQSGWAFFFGAVAIACAIRCNLLVWQGAVVNRRVRLFDECVYTFAPCMIVSLPVWYDFDVIRFSAALAFSSANALLLVVMTSAFLARLARKSANGAGIPSSRFGRGR